jgi:hypothetical protein
MQIVCRNAGRHFEVTRSTGHCVPPCAGGRKSIMKSLFYIGRASLWLLGSTLVAALLLTPKRGSGSRAAAEDRAQRVSIPIARLGCDVRLLTP